LKKLQPEKKRRMRNDITLAEVRQHNTPQDCWIVVNNKVYDVTKFLKAHPGGEKIITDLAGQDCTEQFYAYHRKFVLRNTGKKLLVGTLAGKQPVYNDQITVHEEVPYSENLAFNGHKSPYWKQSHLRFYEGLKQLYIDTGLWDKAESIESAGAKINLKTWKKLASHGFQEANLGPGPHIGMFSGSNFIGGVTAREFDYFHESIFHQLRAYQGEPGFSDSFSANNIGLPPIKNFGMRDKNLQRQVLREVLTGEKKCCLAVSEPGAGSDVAGTACVAKLSPCGKFWIINGMKKWITGGMQADYFTSAVRTGKGRGDLSFVLIPRGPGVTTKAIKTNYPKTAGTSLVILENVRVPVEYTIGKVGEGFKMIMFNFNHERWMIACLSVGSARRLVRECTGWLMQRKAFGKPLIKQPHLRQKLGEIIYTVEAMSAYLDQVTYQLCKMNYKEQNKYLGGPICMLKTFCALNYSKVAEMAVQILGGRGLTKTGMGRKVNRIRDVSQYHGILGGTNEVLVDYAVRQAIRGVPKWSRL